LENRRHIHGEANVGGLTPYSQTVDWMKDQWAARQFLGNPLIGYKIGLCQRDVAIMVEFWLLIDSPLQRQIHLFPGIYGL
jgi:hypothetical protein